MDFELTEEQKLTRQAVRDFAEREIAPVAKELDEKERFYSYERNSIIVNELGSADPQSLEETHCCRHYYSSFQKHVLEIMGKMYGNAERDKDQSKFSDQLVRSI